MNFDFQVVFDCEIVFGNFFVLYYKVQFLTDIQGAIWVLVSEDILDCLINIDAILFVIPKCYHGVTQYKSIVLAVLNDQEFFAFFNAVVKERIDRLLNKFGIYLVVLAPGNFVNKRFSKNEMHTTKRFLEHVESWLQKLQWKNIMFSHFSSICSCHCLTVPLSLEPLQSSLSTTFTSRSIEYSFVDLGNHLSTGLKVKQFKIKS